MPDTGHFSDMAGLTVDVRSPGAKRTQRGHRGNNANDPIAEVAPKNVGAGTVGGFQGNSVGRIGLNCNF